MDENIQQRFKQFLRQLKPGTDEELAHHFSTLLKTLPFNWTKGEKWGR